MKEYAGLVLACLAAAACSNSADEPAVAIDGGAAGSSGYSRCSNDNQCAQPDACVAGTCVQRATNFSVPLAIEISPPGYDPTAALTEKAGVSSSGDWTTIQATASTTVTTAFYVPDVAVFPSTASVLLEVPSLIPGRPALTFETTIMPGSTAVALAVPAMFAGRPGTLNVIPLPPSDQISPPYRFSVADGLQPAVLTLPDNNQTPHGALVDALNKVKATYNARAFLGGALVSNIVPMKPDGTFGLSIPAAVTGELSVELAPVSSSDPWFTFNTMALSGPNANLGTVTLPTYQVPQPVMFMVRGSGSGSPIGGASLRAITVLEPDTSTSSSLGVARYWQSTTTSADGNANLSLIPGVNRTPRLYDVTVVPPPGSAYASTCVQGQPILGGGDTATIVVPLRPVLSGTLHSAQGTQVSGATVTANRNLEMAKVCSATGPPTFTTTTDKSGFFSLPVDPGRYRLDFDPAPGSSAPRLSEDDVLVDTSITRIVQLPRPYLIEGNVVDAVQMPLPNATIRIFEPMCEKTEGCTFPPILRAETQSDDVGHFRAIVALPSSH